VSSPGAIADTLLSFLSDQLISSVARYDPQNASILEEYLGEQVRDDTYDLMANLALLKLYVAPRLCYG